MRKKRKRSDSSRALGGRIVGALSRGAVLVALLAGWPAAAQKKEAPAEAIITGTVFQASGHLLPGAKVEIARESQPGFKRSAVTDSLGDFAVRVPAGAATYRVTATAKGFEPAGKSVEVHQDEKVRTNLILNPLPPASEKRKPSGG
jgi:hypothetical protein